MVSRRSQNDLLNHRQQRSQNDLLNHRQQRSQNDLLNHRTPRWLRRRASGDTSLVEEARQRRLETSSHPRWFRDGRRTTSSTTNSNGRRTTSSTTDSSGRRTTSSTTDGSGRRTTSSTTGGVWFIRATDAGVSTPP
jgi:hypothetical protein